MLDIRLDLGRKNEGRKLKTTQENEFQIYITALRNTKTCNMSKEQIILPDGWSEREIPLV